MYIFNKVELRKMYSRIYWKQIFNFKTSLETKVKAVRSLRAMRKWS